MWYYAIHKPSTCCKMWANFMVDQLGVWWMSSKAKICLSKFVSLLFATTSSTRNVKNSKHQPSWEFWYPICLFKAAIYEVRVFVFRISSPLEHSATYSICFVVDFQFVFVRWTTCRFNFKKIEITSCLVIINLDVGCLSLIYCCIASIWNI